MAVGNDCLEMKHLNWVLSPTSSQSVPFRQEMPLGGQYLNSVVAIISTKPALCGKECPEMKHLPRVLARLAVKTTEIGKMSPEMIAIYP